MEKRRFPRIRRRLVIDYELGGKKYTGFTRDLGASSVFVFASRVPPAGVCLRAWLHLGGGAQVEVAGRVVRAHPSMTARSGMFAGGFGLSVREAGEDYRAFYRALAPPPPATAACP